MDILNPGLWQRGDSSSKAIQIETPQQNGRSIKSRLKNLNSISGIVVKYRNKVGLQIDFARLFTGTALFSIQSCDVIHILSIASLLEMSQIWHEMLREIFLMLYFGPFQGIILFGWNFGGVLYGWAFIYKTK